jgi:MFS family permease
MNASAFSHLNEVTTDIPPRLDRLPWSKWHLRMAIALGITFLLDGLEGGVGGSLAGALKSTEALHFTDAQLGLASTGYLFGTVIGALGFGYLADRYGRKSLFTWTLVFYVCATAATSLSWNLWTFMLCRTLTGAGIGGEYTAINSAIDELIPARVRGRVNLFIGSSFWVGVILGSLIAVGFLSDRAFGLHLGWRLAFLSGLPIAAAVLYLRRHIPESPRWLLTHSRDTEAAEVLDTIENEVSAQFGHLTPETRTVQMHRKEKDPLRSLCVLFEKRYRGRALLCMVMVMAQSFFYNSVFFSSSLILLRFYGLSASHAGVLFLPLAVTNFVGPLALGKLVDTVGRRVMIAINFSLAGLALLASNLLFLHGSLGIVGQVAWWSVAFFFAANAGGSAYLSTSELFPQQIRASAIAVFYGFGTLFAGVLGPYIFGELLNRGDRLPIFWGFMASAAVMLVAGAAQAIWGYAAEQKSLEEIT